MRRDVFQAISDPRRREIIDLLARQPLNLNGIAEKFDISRPAISRHIKILAQCGLIVIHQLGRERYCEANLRPLSEISQWIEKYRAFWTGRLDALERFLAMAEAVPPHDRGRSRTKAGKKKGRNR
ncbi:MAG TPA: metalloregulator ArsR/SmtB family transcription factor [Chryseosolibacter sp.]